MELVHPPPTCPEAGLRLLVHLPDAGELDGEHAEPANMRGARRLRGQRELLTGLSVLCGHTPHGQSTRETPRASRSSCHTRTREQRAPQRHAPVAVLVQERLRQGGSLPGAGEQLALVIVLLDRGGCRSSAIQSLVGGGHDHGVAVNLAQGLAGNALDGHAAAIGWGVLGRKKAGRDFLTMPRGGKGISFIISGWRVRCVFIISSQRVRRQLGTGEGMTVYYLFTRHLVLLNIALKISRRLEACYGTRCLAGPVAFLS